MGELHCVYTLDPETLLHHMYAGFDLDGENKAKGFIPWKLQSPHVRAFHVSYAAVCVDDALMEELMSAF